jgi:hypothetical protein
MKRLILTLAAAVWAMETHAINLVVPNDHALTPGDVGNGYPFALAYYDTQHYVQVYAASQFSMLSTNGGYINAIGFRGGNTSTKMVYGTTLYLSTTSYAVDGLSADMSPDLGPDNVRVYTFNFSLNAISGTLPQPLPFDMVIPLQNSFFYNPTNGNLLLYMTISDSSGTEHAQPYVDTVESSTDSVSRKHWDAFDTHSWLDSYGAVTQFGIVPVVAPKPKVSTFALSNTNLIATGTGGSYGSVYCVLMSTNPAISMTNWVPVLTNAFDSAGNFSFTNAVDPTLPQQFYRLQIQ